MKYIINPAEAAPAYFQLYRQLREDIVSGSYSYGSKLPSKRSLAEALSISTVTVEHAYSLLADEGYIEQRERSGNFVIFRSSDGFAASPKESSAAQVLSPAPESHEQYEFPYSVMAKTMRKVMAERAERILERSPSFGRGELRESIRQYLSRSRGIRADVSQIIVGSGSEYLYSLIVKLLGTDKRYAIESPSYMKIEQVYASSGLVCEKLALGRAGIESAALRESKADILHVSPYRSFPSGVSTDASKRHEYIRWASSGGRYIIEDDFESEFSVSKKPEETLFSLSAQDNVIYMNSFSRTVSPSLRVGYMVIPKALVPMLDERIGFYSSTVPTFIQLVLAELISNGDFERHINRIRRRKRREAES